MSAQLCYVCLPAAALGSAGSIELHAHTLTVRCMISFLCYVARYGSTGVRLSALQLVQYYQHTIPQKACRSSAEFSRPTMSNPSCLRLMNVKLQPAVRPKTPVNRKSAPSCLGAGVTEEDFTSDKEAAMASFHKAFTDSQAEATRIPGLQSFAGAVRSLCRHFMLLPADTSNNSMYSASILTVSQIPQPNFAL